MSFLLAQRNIRNEACETATRDLDSIDEAIKLNARSMPEDIEALGDSFLRWITNHRDWREKTIKDTALSQDIFSEFPCEAILSLSDPGVLRKLKEQRAKRFEEQRARRERLAERERETLAERERERLIKYAADQCQSIVSKWLGDEVTKRLDGSHRSPQVRAEGINIFFTIDLSSDWAIHRLDIPDFYPHEWRSRIAQAVNAVTISMHEPSSCLFGEDQSADKLVSLHISSVLFAALKLVEPEEFFQKFAEGIRQHSSHFQKYLLQRVDGEVVTHTTRIRVDIGVDGELDSVINVTQTTPSYSYDEMVRRTIQDNFNRITLGYRPIADQPVTFVVPITITARRVAD